MEAGEYGRSQSGDAALPQSGYWQAQTQLGASLPAQEPWEAVLFRAPAPPAIFCRMRKTLSPDPGAPSPWESTDGLLVKVWAWKLGALDAFPGYIRNLLCGTTYFCAHVSSYSFSLARRFFQTFHLAARMCFSFCRVLFSDSKASWHAVASTWTRRPLLPRLLLPLHLSHQSLLSPGSAAAL